MAIVHIVMFSFKPLIPPDEIQDVSAQCSSGNQGNHMERILIENTKVCDRMLALKDNCIHPESKKPYVKTGRGGKDNSPEGQQVSEAPGH